MRTNTSGPWIPLRLTWRSKSVGKPTIVSLVNVRGYDVESHEVFATDSTLSLVEQRVTICGKDLLPANASKIQFRWMNSDSHQPGYRDMWAIFNVTADLINRDGGTLRILDTENSE